MGRKKKQRPLIYIALPFVCGDGYAEALELGRLLAVCAEDLKMQATYPHGHTPDSQPDPANVKPLPHELATIGERMIAGDGEMHPKADAVWLVGDHETVELQRAWAEAAGVPCERLDGGALAVYNKRGAVLQARNEARSKADEKKIPRCELQSPYHVVKAYLDGAGRVLGAKALSLEPRESGPPSPFAARDRQEICGLQIAMADGIMREAMRSRKWQPETIDLLRWTVVEGRSALDAARNAGYSGSKSGASQWAKRRIDAALKLISAGLDRRRHDAQTKEKHGETDED